LSPCSLFRKKKTWSVIPPGNFTLREKVTKKYSAQKKKKKSAGKIVKRGSIAKKKQQGCRGEQ